MSWAASSHAFPWRPAQVTSAPEANTLSTSLLAPLTRCSHLFFSGCEVWAESSFPESKSAYIIFYHHNVSHITKFVIWGILSFMYFSQSHTKEGWHLLVFFFYFTNNCLTLQTSRIYFRCRSLPFCYECNYLKQPIVLPVFNLRYHFSKSSAIPSTENRYGGLTEVFNIISILRNKE